MAEAQSHPATTSVYESDFDPTTNIYLSSSFPKLSDKHGTQRTAPAPITAFIGFVGIFIGVIQCIDFICRKPRL